MEHPYSAYVGSPEWCVIDQAIKHLTENHDMVETTAHDHIVGYICRALAEKKPAARTAPGETTAAQLAALRSLREAVRLANPTGRDLVAELIAERRIESERE